MRPVKALLILSVAFAGIANSAFACSFGGSEVFRPSLSEWEQHEGPAQKTEGAEGDYWERVPQPVVKVTEIARGSAAPGSDCSDAGTISLEISLPASSTYSIADFAFYFRVQSGQLPDAIFPDVPLVGTVEGGKARLLLAWLDGHPSTQIPLDLKVELFLVTNDLSIGPSTFFEVQAGKGG
jgi:hypothetical protein